MKSAYRVLGVPGNATSEEIRTAFEEARVRYPKERILNDQDAFERFNELKEAYKVLSEPGLREMHDRKLNSSAPAPGRKPVVVIVEDETSGVGKTLKIMAIAVILMFAIGTYYSHQRNEQKRLRFEQEQAELKKQKEDEAKAEAAIQAEERERLRAKAIADSQEARHRAESAYAGRQAMANQNAAIATQQRQLAIEKSAAEQVERQRRVEAQQRVMEAQQRAASDQQQLRNLCMMNYGRPNC